MCARLARVAGTTSSGVCGVPDAAHGVASSRTRADRGSPGLGLRRRPPCRDPIVRVSRSRPVVVIRFRSFAGPFPGVSWPAVSPCDSCHMSLRLPAPQGWALPDIVHCTSAPLDAFAPPPLCCIQYALRAADGRAVQYGRFDVIAYAFPPPAIHSFVSFLLTFRSTCMR